METAAVSDPVRPAATTFIVYWCPICERQMPDSWHKVGRAGLIPQGQEEHDCERIEVVRAAALDGLAADLEAKDILAQAATASRERQKKRAESLAADLEAAREALRQIAALGIHETSKEAHEAYLRESSGWDLFRQAQALAAGSVAPPHGDTT